MNTLKLEMVTAMGYLEVLQFGVITELLGDLAQEHATLEHAVLDAGYRPAAERGDTDEVVLPPAADCAVQVRLGADHLYTQYNASKDYCYLVLNGVVMV